MRRAQSTSRNHFSTNAVFRNWADFGFAVCALALVACGDDSTPMTDGGVDATTSDAGVDAPMIDAALDAPATEDSGPESDAGPRPDSGGGGMPGHMSYVPDGLAPETATRLVILGDSISAGSGAGGASRVYHALLADNDDSAWPDDSENDLVALTGGMVDIVDYSRGGATTRNLRGQTDGALEEIGLPAEGHTIVVVTIGGNDLQSAILGGNPTGTLLDQAGDALRTMASRFLDPDDFPDGTSLYVAAVYDPSDGEAQIDGCFFNLMLPELVDALDVWRERYVSIGTEMGFSVVDALGHFHGHGHNYDNPENPFFDADDNTFWFSDCIHPNTRGHHELRRLFFEAMNPAYTIE